MPPFLNSSEILLSTIVYSTIWIVLRNLVKAKGSFKHASTVLNIHSYIQVLLSTILFSLTTLSLIPSPHSRILKQVQADQAFIPRYAYHFSKFYEYFDIFFFVANGGEADLHFGFHHLTTPYLTYFRVLNDFEGWQVFAALNAFHHTLMYGFFAGASWTHVFLPWTRYIQLVVGLAWDLWIIRSKKEVGKGIRGNWVAVGLLSAYLILLTREIRMRRLAKNEEQDTNKTRRIAEDEVKKRD